MPELDPSVKNTVNKTVAGIQGGKLLAFNAQISNIPGLIKMTLGEPDFNVPDHAKLAAIKGIINNDSHYDRFAGKPALVKAISEKIEHDTGVHYDPMTEVVVTSGGTEALRDTFAALINPGEEVLVPTPVYGQYFPVVGLSGAKIVELNTQPDGFVLTLEHLKKAIEEHPNAKAVLLNYPENPTGRSYTKDELNAMGEVLKAHHMMIVTDEIYSDIEYDEAHTSLATAFPEQTILVSGLSKAYAMTGWRIGYLAGPADIVKEINKVHTNTSLQVSDPMQDAAIEALVNGKDDPAKMTAIYKERRDYIVKALKDMGFEMATPQGAFYIFAKIPAKFGTDDTKFALALAKKAKVGVIPGSAFGAGGEGYVRMSYATALDDIKECMKRMKANLKDL